MGVRTSGSFRDVDIHVFAPHFSLSGSPQIHCMSNVDLQEAVGWSAVSDSLHHMSRCALPCPLAFAGGSGRGVGLCATSSAAATNPFPPHEPVAVEPYVALQRSSLAHLVSCIAAATCSPTATELSSLRAQLRVTGPWLQRLVSVPGCESMALSAMAALGAVLSDLGDDAVLAVDVHDDPWGHTFPTRDGEPLFARGALTDYARTPLV